VNVVYVMHVVYVISGGDSKNFFPKEKQSMHTKTRAETIRLIQETGYLREIHMNQSLNNPKLTVQHDPSNSLAFGWGGGTGFIFYLSITTNRATRLIGFGDLELAGQLLSVDWWELEDKVDIYRFDGKRGPEFHRSIVLNHRVGDRGVVRPGIPVEGWLLGRCFTSLPSSCREGSSLAASLSIVDGFGTVHAPDLSLRFDPTLNIELARVRSSLYGPDEHRPNYSDRENEPAIRDQIQIVPMPSLQIEEHNKILAADDSAQSKQASAEHGHEA
jgi:hypothetical protein